MPRPRLLRVQALRRLFPAPGACPPHVASSSPLNAASNPSHKAFPSPQSEQQELTSRYFAGTRHASSFASSPYLLKQHSRVSVVCDEPHAGQEVSAASGDRRRSADVEDAVVVEYVKLEDAHEAVGTREDDGSSDVEFEEVVEEGVVISSAEEELYVIEGADEGSSLLEDAEPRPDPEGRSYLHVLSVEEVQTILEKVRAEDVQVIPVRDLCEWADHLIVASGHSARHLRGISDSIVYEVKKRSTNVGNNLYPTVEGRESDQWMVVDCGSIVVHVFRDDVRGYYNLEELWRKRRSSNALDIGL